MCEPKQRKLNVFVNYAFATPQEETVAQEETQHAFRLQNLEFFLRHGVTFSATANITYGVTITGSAAATVGEHFSASSVLERHSEQARQLGLPQVFLLHRKNGGFDFGAHAAMLDEQCKHMGLTPKCELPYDAFIFFNDGVRGPFLPSYMPKGYHWTQAFLEKLTALQHPRETNHHFVRNVALVGTSIVCLSKEDFTVKRYPSFIGPKVEGFAFAVTNEALAYVRKETTVFSLHNDKREVIIKSEYNLTRTVLSAPHNWSITSLLKEHEGINFRDIRTWGCNDYTHPSRSGSYGPGADIAPLEVIFHKARWHNGGQVSEKILNLYSGWQDRNGGSYESLPKSIARKQMDELSSIAKSSDPSEIYSCYVARYPDIFESFCNLRSLECNWKKIASHWIRKGKNREHRVLECDREVSSGLTSFTAPPLRKWVFAISSDTDGYDNMIKVAVLSAKKFTSLTPVAVVTGAQPTTSAIVKWLRCMGVHIIMHKPAWADAVSTGLRNAIANGFNQKISPLYADENGMIASFVRLDLPNLGFTDDYILYTDVDIIFTAEVKTTDFGTVMPKYFTIGTENQKNKVDGNMGVMLINVKNMRNWYNEMIEFVFSDENMANGLIWGDQPGVQGALKTFFTGTHQVLEEPLFNWMPYWGFNPAAKLIHFNGPKPSDYVKYFASENTSALFTELFSHCTASYDCKRYIDLYMDWTSEVLQTCS